MSVRRKHSVSTQQSLLIWKNKYDCLTRCIFVVWIYRANRIWMWVVFMGCTRAYRLNRCNRPYCTNTKHHQFISLRLMFLNQNRFLLCKWNGKQMKKKTERNYNNKKTIKLIENKKRHGISMPCPIYYLKKWATLDVQCLE